MILLLLVLKLMPTCKFCCWLAALLKILCLVDFDNTPIQVSQLDQKSVSNTSRKTLQLFVEIYIHPC